MECRPRACLLQVACTGCIGCRWVRGVLMLAGRSGCEPACKSRVQATRRLRLLVSGVPGAAARARPLALSPADRARPARRRRRSGAGRRLEREPHRQLQRLGNPRTGQPRPPSENASTRERRSARHPPPETHRRSRRVACTRDLQAGSQPDLPASIRTPRTHLHPMHPVHATCNRETCVGLLTESGPPVPW